MLALVRNRIPVGRAHRLDNDFVFEPSRKLDAGDIDGAPEDISSPERQRQTDGPSDEKAQTVLEVGLLAGDAPDVGHERVPERVEDRAVDDVEGKGDFAEILGERVHEQPLDVARVVDAVDDCHGAERLREAVRLQVGLGRDLPGPHVEGSPLVADVGGGAQVQAEDEEADPEPAAGETEDLVLGWVARDPRLLFGRGGWALPCAVDQVGLGHEHPGQEENHVPAAPAHAEPDEGADKGEADAGADARRCEDGEEEHDGAAEFHGDSPEVGVVVVVVEGPVPGVHEPDDSVVPVPELFEEGLHDGRVLFIGADDGVARVEDLVRVVVHAQSHGDEHHGNADNGRDVQAQAAAEG